MSTTKKILISIVCLLLVGVFVFTLAWGIINANKVKEAMSGSSLYTYEDLEKAKNEGYDLALSDKSEYERIIADYKNQLTSFSAIIGENNVLIEDLREQVSLLEQEISDKDATISSLNAQLEYLRQHIDEYLQENELVVTFKVNGEVYETLVVEKNTTISIDDPVAPDNMSFVGWFLNDELIDLSSYVLTDSVLFEAKFEWLVDWVSTSWNGEQDFIGGQMFTVNGTTYYSWGTTKFYELDNSTKTWTALTPSEYNVNGACVWVHSYNGYDAAYYCMSNTELYRFASVAKTWSTTTMYVGEGYVKIENFDGRDVWHHGADTYLSFDGKHYIKDRALNWFYETTFTGLQNFNGRNVLNVGNDTYVVTETGIYNFNGVSNFSLSIALPEHSFSTLDDNFFVLNDKLYCVEGDYQVQYNFETSRWEEKIWRGVEDFDPYFIWTDGTDYYYSVALGKGVYRHYVLVV